MDGFTGAANANFNHKFRIVFKKEQFDICEEDSVEEMKCLIKMSGIPKGTSVQTIYEVATQFYHRNWYFY